MLYYRRKILLSLLEIFGGKLGKTKLQKLLFIYANQFNHKIYDFVPYQYGCYSFQLNWDLGALELKGFVKQNRQYWSLNSIDSIIPEISLQDNKNLLQLFDQYHTFTLNDLLSFTYTQYPYYAIKSRKLKQILKANAFENVKKQIPKKEDISLFTIGYEGITLETYLNKLIQADIKILCDVRKNPLSQKFGFSKSILSSACDTMGIKYLHIPELGIESKNRKNLKTQEDYDDLFLFYQQEVLPDKKESIDKISELLKSYKRVALTCFEAHHCQCHRGTLAEFITSDPTWSYQLKHL